MKGKNQKGRATASPEAATPFFARFLENQHGDAEAKHAANVTMKYPSDRDEGDVGLHAAAEAAPTQGGPSRMTLKYPSDRDEIDNVCSPIDAEAVPTNAGPSRMTLKYPSDRDEIDLYSTPYGNAADAR